MNCGARAESEFMSRCRRVLYSKHSKYSEAHLAPVRVVSILLQVEVNAVAHRRGARVSYATHAEWRQHHQQHVRHRMERDIRVAVGIKLGPGLGEELDVRSGD